MFSAGSWLVKGAVRVSMMCLVQTVAYAIMERAVSESA